MDHRIKYEITKARRREILQECYWQSRGFADFPQEANGVRSHGKSPDSAVHLQKAADDTTLELYIISENTQMIFERKKNTNLKVNPHY